MHRLFSKNLQKIRKEKVYAVLPETRKKTLRRRFDAQILALGSAWHKKSIEGLKN